MTRRRVLALLTVLTVLDLAACGLVWAVLGWWQPGAVEVVALALAWIVFGRLPSRRATLRRELTAYGRACDQCRTDIWRAVEPGPAEPRMRQAGHD